MKINPVKISENNYELFYEDGRTMACFIKKDDEGMYFVSGGGEIGYTYEEIHAIYKLMSEWKRRLIEKDIRECKDDHPNCEPSDCRHCTIECPGK